MENMREILDCEKKALNVVKSRYLLCLLVSQRIHQLEKGARPSIETESSDLTPRNYYLLALKEIIQGNMDLEQIPAN